MKIVGTLHVAQVGLWKKSWAYLEKALSKGLARRSQDIQITVLYADKADLDFLEPLRRECPFSTFHVQCIANLNAQERPALLRMRQVSEKAPLAIFWYAHTKGIRWWGTPKEFLIDLWVRWLLQTMIVDQECVLAEFDKGADVVGTNQTDHCYQGQHPHFSGNFWWASSTYLKTCADSIGHEYIDPEFWLLKQANSKTHIVDLANSHMDHHTGQYSKQPHKAFVQFLKNERIVQNPRKIQL